MKRHGTTRQKHKGRIANKVAFNTGPMEINCQLEQGEVLTLIDVRDEEDYEKSHLPGAIHVPEVQWKTPFGAAQRCDEHRVLLFPDLSPAAMAALEFADQGYPVMEKDGGFEAWQKNNLEVERGNGRG